MFFIHIFFTTPFLALPCTITRFLDLFCTFSPAHRRVTRDTFIFRSFLYLLTASATVLSGHFLTTSVFYLTLLPDIFGTFPTFWHNLLLSRFCWEPAVTFWKVARLHTDPQNTDPVHLIVIYSNPQSSMHLNFVFMHVNIAKVLLVVKTLIVSAATLFSSHENIKQQPN